MIYGAFFANSMFLSKMNFNANAFRGGGRIEKIKIGHTFQMELEARKKRRRSGVLIFVYLHTPSPRFLRPRSLRFRFLRTT